MVRKIKVSKRALGLFLALCILTAALPFRLKTQVSAAPTEVAGDIVVTNTADSGAGSLREAVATAVNGDVITFADSLFGAGGTDKITITLASTIVIGSTQISIRGKISTEGEPQVILDGGNTSQVLSGTSSEGLSLYGLQIQNGKSDLTGGGVYLSLSSSTLMAESCVFFNNAASSNGGGVYAGNLQVIDCVFDGNISESSGGGAYVENNLTMSDCVVKNNQAGFDGGGVRARKSELINTMFLNNISTGSGYNGGGIYSSNTTARNCIFDANTSLSEGGGAHVSGGEFIGCTFKNNKSDAGGGLYSSGALSVVNSTFIQNEAESLGGAIRTANNLEIKYSSSIQTG